MLISMKTLLPVFVSAAESDPRKSGAMRGGLGWLAAVVGVASVAWATRSLPGWIVMWAMATAEFLILKVATLHGTSARGWRAAGYMVAWPGMNAAKFFT